LYQIIMGKEVHYAADNDELDIFKKQHPNRKFDVHYLKGLGELSPQELLDTTIDRTKRRLKKVVIQNDRLCLEKVEELMGKSADKRKEFITKNAYRANV
ncbi:MAG: DNA topoisomerase IV subunit B, partial [Clostridium sp.]